MSETIGQQLKQVRLAKNLSLAKVAQATRIREHYLKALEEDDFEALPSAVQARGFLKLYADFLGLSLDEMLQRQRAAELDSPSAASKAPPVPPVASPQTPKAGGRRKKVLPAEETSPAPPEADSEAKPAPASPKLDAPLPLQGQEASEEVAHRLSQSIFEEIGASLRQRRESLGISLNEAEEYTHVRKHYLEALENGQFERLPSSVQARGMLNNYARFLDMDVEAILLRYAEGLQIQLEERRPKTAPEEKKNRGGNFPPGLRRYFSVDIFVGVGLGVLLIGLILWGAGRLLQMNASITPQPTAPSILEVLVVSPETPSTPESTPSPASGATEESMATFAVTLPAAGSDPVQVVLIASRSAWVKVTVDGELAYEGRIVAGTAYPFSGQSQIEVLTGDGAAVSIIYNQSNLGAMGAYGEVVNRIYTASNILIPTATFTPSPTISPTFTVTPRPSATPRPSSTPRPSATPRPSVTTAP